MKKTLISSSILCCLLVIADGRGIDLGLCGETNFACQCGGDDRGYTIYVPIKECTFFYRFKPYCKPCENVKPEGICSRYRQCLECTVSQCTRCPPNKLGMWCTAECECQNGGSCNHYDGACTCRPGFKGQRCEHSTACPVPETRFPLQASPFPETGNPILIDFTCAEGFTVVGPSRIICSLNQQWDHLPPNCVRNCRPVPNTLQNGHVNAALAPLRYSFACEDNFALIGDETIACQPDGQWSAVPPRCHENKMAIEDKTDDVDCTTKALEIFTSYELTVFSVSCPPGCDNQAESNVYGTAVYAETSSICRAAIHSGKMTTGGGNVTVFYVGQIPYFAPSIQNQIHSLELTDENNSTKAFAFSLMENTVEEEEEADVWLDGCKDPGPLVDGHSQQSNASVVNWFPAGSSISYRCHDTHYLRGSSTITCTENMTWDWPKPRCLAIMCRDMETMRNVTLQYIRMENKEKYSQNGYPLRLVSLKRKLNADHNVTEVRNLDDEKFVADLLQNVTIPDGFHPIGTRAIYGCESRYYRLTGFKSRVCQTNGQWSGRNTKRHCTPICGRSEAGKRALVANGNATAIGQWPWQVSIGTSRNKIFFCGGSVISEKFVLTAAHCITFEWTTRPLPIDSYRVTAGKHYFNPQKDDDQVQERTVHEAYLHPDFDPKTFDSDIALIEVNEEFTFNTRVQPVCLPTARTTKRNIVDGARGVVTGWGVQSSKQVYPEILQEAIIPVLTTETCERDNDDSGLVITVTKRMFCGGNGKTGVSACTGDSGGPFVFVEETGTRWVIEGIVSWALPGTCGEPNNFTGFTLVQKFNKWISQYVH